MRDVLPALADWQAEMGRIAIATVTATWGSAPRQPGAALAVHPDGRILGSVSGGCVEGGVAEVAEEVLRTGIPRLVRFGVSDAEALAVGLTCGGTIEVLIRAVRREDLDLSELHRRVSTEAPVAIATIVEHADRPDLVGRSIVVTELEVDGSLDVPELQSWMVATARDGLTTGDSDIRTVIAPGVSPRNVIRVLIEVFTRRPRMIVVGAADHADAVARIGRFLGFHVTVCDARATFATPERFPSADRVVVDWPHRLIRAEQLDHRAAVCVLTHDPKFDVPALVAALSGSCGYVGVMGSRRTHDDRMARLREAGITEAQLARLRSPIGLDLGGRTPEETAVAIAAEIVQLRSGGTGRPLRQTTGPIHPPRSSPSDT